MNSYLNDDGEIVDMIINGVAIFGRDCYKIPEIPKIFNSSS
jgi:hypothetical protein